ncbi:MAG: DNA polymerase III subunit gamma/tau [Erysipelotrichaceae bacterium]|nr:DNA polymerase III subunit gamma/tau [Erysipelotrichaceae bacterium]MDY6035133.1 DNA polymerase III subunit gamma/tau [Bulleidia sp.]
MSKLALYQKYRSSTFSEVVGQEYIVQSIKNAVLNNKVGHAYLFCGPRGTGKTTMARLLAKAVNCEHPEEAPCEHCSNCEAANNQTHPDIIEINAANETHVEDVRDLIDRSQLAPMQGHHKVYIIDEVHQLSGAAASALLKTLEEPPENVIFILATTDPQKLLSTIISRCQRFDFTKLQKNQIKEHLLEIAKKEDIYLDEEAADNIAVLCDGGMRDALSIMDQCASYTSDHITAEDVDRIYGLTTVAEKVSLIQSINTMNLEDILNKTKKYEQQGIDFQKFVDGMVDILKDVVIYHSTRKSNLLKVLDEDVAKSLSESINQQTCMHMIDKLFNSKEKFRFTTSAASCFEVICLEVAIPTETQPIQVNTKPIQKPETTYVVPSVEIKEDIKKPEENKTENITKPVIKEVKTNELTTDEIISLLVQCNKQSKAEDDVKLNKINTLFDMESKKYTSLLEETKVGASGKDCLILISDSKVLANRMNEETMNRNLYQFIKEQLQIDKMMYVTTSENFKNATVQYVELMKANNLPEPMKIIRYQIEKEKEITLEERAKDIFNPDILEIEE